MYILNIMELIGWILAFIIIALLLATIKLYGRLPLDLIWPMTKLALQTEKVFLLILAYIFLIFSFIKLIYPNFLFPLPFIFSFMQSMLVIFYICIPPSILLLAASGPKSSDLVFRLRLAAILLPVVHMLSGQNIGLSSREIQDFTGLRTLKNDKWRPKVRFLTEITPIVIIDTRETTPAIEFEAQRMLTNRFRSKAVFVVGSNYESPVLSELAIFNQIDAMPDIIVTEDEISSFVTELLFQYIFSSKRGK